MIRRDHPILDAAEVAPRLWIGSHPPVSGHRCGDHPVEYNADVLKCGFHFLVLCAREYQPDKKFFPGVEVHYAPFDDNHSGITPGEAAAAAKAAQATVAAHRRGQACLVTCMAGRNRSGLVTALALSELANVSGREAAETVRERRGLGALTNLSFRGMLERKGAGRFDPCELCEAAPVTRRYWEDEVCWIADCKTCGCPMAVLKAHSRHPSAGQRAHMIRVLRLCGRPGARYVLDDAMRTEPRHYHVHLRPARQRRLV